MVAESMQTVQGPAAKVQLGRDIKNECAFHGVSPLVNGVVVPVIIFYSVISDILVYSNEL